MMGHKAYVFDYGRFEAELKPILESALLSGDCEELRDFIHRNRRELTDPYEGEPLPVAWETLVEHKDAHQYGDFALTKYYDVQADIGLGHEWMEIQDLLAESLSQEFSPILGFPVGTPGNVFDAGKMGTYFQSAETVATSHAQLCAAAEQMDSRVLRGAAQMLAEALQAEAGLYVTF